VTINCGCSRCSANETPRMPTAHITSNPCAKNQRPDNSRAVSSSSMIRTSRPSVFRAAWRDSMSTIPIVRRRRGRSQESSVEFAQEPRHSFLHEETLQFGSLHAFRWFGHRSPPASLRVAVWIGPSDGTREYFPATVSLAGPCLSCPPCLPCPLPFRDCDS
jgi:hypothetical protein